MPPINRNLLKLSQVGRNGKRFGRKVMLSSKTVAEPDLRHFINKEKALKRPTEENEVTRSSPPYLGEVCAKERIPKKVFIETYGCQMNFNDSEIVLAILSQSKRYNQEQGDYTLTLALEEADIVLLMTCAIRENAEGKIWNRLDQLAFYKSKHSLKTVGILGCMAERLKEKFFDLKGHAVDVICGPDAYRDLPRLLDDAEMTGEKAVNVLLSLDETYGDINPVRLDSERKHSAFVSIMRGCNNMCSYCIVPFTRGRERSRPVTSILEEVKILTEEQNVKEIIFLGQNVNSYQDDSDLADSAKEIRMIYKTAAGSSANASAATGTAGTGADAVGRGKEEPAVELIPMSKDFSTIYRHPRMLKGSSKRFVDLLDILSKKYPQVRMRYTSPHPKDFPDGLLHLMKERHNLCKSIHLPAQSGSSSVLERMRRGYTREAYLALVENIYSILGGGPGEQQLRHWQVGLSSDFIVGFCGETEEDHALTLSLMKEVNYSMAYMFAYSMRPSTTAHRRFQDDVPEEVKNRRLRELVNLYYEQQLNSVQEQLASLKQQPTTMIREELVLIDAYSKKSKEFFQGKIDNGRTVCFPIRSLPITPPASPFGTSSHYQQLPQRLPEIGDFVSVKLVDVRGTTPIGEPIAIRPGLIW